MVHTVVWRVGSAEALDFWAERLGVERDGDVVRFADPEGLQHELVVAHVPDEPLIADHPGDSRGELALQGFEGVRAYARDPEVRTGAVPRRSSASSADGTRWETRGDSRGGWIEYEDAPEPSRASPAPARCTTSPGRRRWTSTRPGSERVAEAGGRPTPIIDRFWFRSIYFREPSGVLFEIATLGPGFATDEDPAHLGETLILPPDFEHLRAQVEPLLTPLPNPRENWTRT